jgi:hypothetical protein
MFEQPLRNTTRNVLANLGKLPLTENFYLTGGTALALSYGHRKSDDLDFFSRERFSPATLQTGLEGPFRFRLRVHSEGTLHCELNKVNVSFLYYPYPVLRRLLNYKGVAVSHPLDVALTKITAIAQRGSRRDFVDLYWACHKGLTLPLLFKRFPEKYGKTNYSPYHLIRSLVYFTDAEKEPMPKLLLPLSWRDVRQFIETEVRKLRLSVL